jgi:hypothetical protein
MLGRPAQVLAARGLQAELWAELGLKVPSQKRLDTIGSSLRAAMTEADSTFTHLLRLNPSGVPIIRRYSTFLAEVRPSILRDFFLFLSLVVPTVRPDLGGKARGFACVRVS